MRQKAPTDKRNSATFNLLYGTGNSFFLNKYNYVVNIISAEVVAEVVAVDIVVDAIAVVVVVVEEVLTS